MEQQIMKGRNNILWIKEGANYYKAIQHKEPVINSDVLDSIPDYQILKKYKIEGWFRLNDEKDFITQIIQATTPERAEQLFRSKYKHHFINIYVDLI